MYRYLSGRWSLQTRMMTKGLLPLYKKAAMQQGQKVRFVLMKYFAVVGAEKDRQPSKDQYLLGAKLFINVPSNLMHSRSSVLGPDWSLSGSSYALYSVHEACHCVRSHCSLPSHSRLMPLSCLFVCV